MPKRGCAPHCSRIHAYTIRAATSRSADLLGWEDTGRLRPGFRADLIAVENSPLQNIRMMEKIHFVMHDGQIIRMPHEDSCPKTLAAQNRWLLK